MLSHFKINFLNYLKLKKWYFLRKAWKNAFTFIFFFFFFHLIVFSYFSENWENLFLFQKKLFVYLKSGDINFSFFIFFHKLCKKLPTKWEYKKYIFSVRSFWHFSYENCNVGRKQTQLCKTSFWLFLLMQFDCRLWHHLSWEKTAIWMKFYNSWITYKEL